MNKTALITGGAKGLGAAVAESLADAGCIVALLGRDAASLAQAKARLEPRAQRVVTQVCDLQEDAAIHAACQALTAEIGGVDILVNNAGVAEAAPFDRGDMSQWDRALRLNARAPALLTSQLLGGMKEKGDGRIINIGSVVALEGARLVSAYAASKHALLGWSRSLALELAHTGVTVNTLCPGYIDTPIFQRAVEQSAPRFEHDPERAANAILRSAGQTRLLQVQEVARWVTFLAQDPGSLNGEAIRLCP